MGLEVHVLDLGDIELDASFLVLAHDPGTAVQVPTAVLERGEVIGRTFDRVPGPLIANADFPGKLTRDHRAAAPA